ncbi:Pkinase-domain-containing protein, partial [Rhizodiscina lignyota]
LCQSLKDRYTVTTQALGMGGHGAVFAAVHRRTGRQVACKVVDLRCQLDENDTDPQPPIIQNEHFSTSESRNQKRISKANKLFKEFQVLQDIDHPNIVRLEKAFWTTNSIYIFQELLPGGDLFSFIEARGGPFEEAEAAILVLQILKALDFLHTRGIVHRDLKPDNILLSSPLPNARVVLTDFGHARHLPESNEDNCIERPFKRQRMTSVVGTFEYCAPEVHKRNPLFPEEGYSKAIDIWSLGCITFLLLSGEQPFVNHRDPLFRVDPLQAIMTLASKCDLDAIDNSPNWRSISKRPKQLVKSLLVLDEAIRLTAKQALDHPWF